MSALLDRLRAENGLKKPGRPADPRIRAYAEKYNVPEHRVRRVGLDHLDAMEENARAYLLRCTQPQGWKGGKVAVRHLTGAENAVEKRNGVLTEAVQPIAKCASTHPMYLPIKRRNRLSSWDYLTERQHDAGHL